MKKVKSISLVVIALLCSLFLLGSKRISSYKGYQKVLMGVVEEGERCLIIKQHTYPIVKVQQVDYIPLTYLKQAGVKVKEEDENIYLELEQERDMYHLTLHLRGAFAYMNDKPIYCGNVRSYVLKANEELLIPIEALNDLWEIVPHQSIYEAKEKWILEENKFIKITEKNIKNISDHIMKISWISLFWNGEKFIEVPKENVILEQGEVYSLDTPNNGEFLYITTFLSQLNEEKLDVAHGFGQKNINFFINYSEVVRKEELYRIFPKYTIKALMKYEIGDLKVKANVELWRAEKRSYFIIKDKNGKKFQIPYNSIAIDGDYGTLGGTPTAKDIEDFVKINAVTSKTPYLIWTDIYRQRTYVLKKQEERWQLEKRFICSTGKNINPTPQGIYEVQYTIPFIGMDKGYRCKNALVFYRDYMFHSILFDKTGTYIKSGQYDLGRKVSHGCVRLSEEDSLWLYQHIPVGSTVWIR